MNENEFGYRVRQALNESAAHLDYKTAYRLEQARRKAAGRSPCRDRAGLSPHFGARRWPASGRTQARVGWAQRLGLIAPLLALVIGFVASTSGSTSSASTELADIDFAVLLDDAPIDAYADKGFGALLQTNTDEI